MEKSEDMDKESALQLFTGLARMALRVYPDRLSYVDETFGKCADMLAQGTPLKGARASKLLRELSMQPLEWHADVLKCRSISRRGRGSAPTSSTTTRRRW